MGIGTPSIGMPIRAYLGRFEACRSSRIETRVACQTTQAARCDVALTAKLNMRSALRYPARAGHETPATLARVVTMEKIVALCKRRGFIFQSSEIYGGLASTYDYGHYGVLLKGNVKGEWWRAVVQQRDDVVALDAAILMHPRTWEASGHLEGFTDPRVQCLGECKRRWREDHLREDAVARDLPPDAELRCPVCGGELS